jgi:hypothetical protein
MPDWKKHCPIDKDEWPVQRQAWHAGWIYYMEHGPVFRGEDAGFMSADMTDNPVLCLPNGSAQLAPIGSNRSCLSSSPLRIAAHSRVQSVPSWTP